MTTKNAGPAGPPQEQNPKKRQPLTDQHRRRAEAVDVLADTLLDMLLRERRARREVAARGARGSASA